MQPRQSQYQIPPENDIQKDYAQIIVSLVFHIPLRPPRELWPDDYCFILFKGAFLLPGGQKLVAISLGHGSCIIDFVTYAYDIFSSLKRNSISTDHTYKKV